MKLLLAMIAKIGKDRGGDRHLPGGADQHRVAVGRLTRGEFGGDAAAGADPVFDDRGRAGILLKFLHDQASEQIVAAAGGKADDEMDRPARIVGLCARIPGG